MSNTASSSTNINNESIDNSTNDNNNALPPPQQRKYLKYFGSLRVDNVGAVARDHLANERTYLAWLRSSLTFASIGVAITQFFRLQSSSTTQNLIEATQQAVKDYEKNNDQNSINGFQGPPLLITTPEFYRYVESIQIKDKKLSKLSTMLGAWFIITGIVIIVMGVYRYFVTQHYLQKGVYPVSRVVVTLLFLITFAVSLLNCFYDDNEFSFTNLFDIHTVDCHKFCCHYSYPD